MLNITSPTGHRRLFWFLSALVATMTVTHTSLATEALAKHITGAHSAQQLPMTNATATNSAAPSMETSNAVIRVGVLAYMETEYTTREWDPIRQFLQSALPTYDIEFTYLDLDGISNAAMMRSIDFALTSPGQYVTLELAAGASRIATVERDRHSVNGLGLGSTVITRSDRHDLNSMQDLRGHVVAATTEEGFGGYQLVWRELAAIGMDPASDLGGRSFVGFPMTRVLAAVADKQADAGIVRTCMLENVPDWQTRYKVLSQQPDTGLGCLSSTRLYPDWPFATFRHTPTEVARTVAVALLQMPATADGLRFTVPADYQSVHELFRELQIGPYGYLREHGVAAMARRNWPVLALLGIVAMLWLMYTFWIEKLVHVRTRALRHALEERKLWEARMLANKEAVDHMSRFSILGELSTTLAHELNQPLAGITNYSRGLLRRLDNNQLSNEAVRLAATEITKQAQHAANVLSRIRTFARKRAAVHELRRPVDVVSDAVSLFCGMQTAFPQLHVDDRLPPEIRIRVDSQQILQVLLNLLKNSLDAMSDIPVGERSIEISLMLQEGNVSICVRDHGSGMTTAQQARLFEPFYTSKEHGLGLGLSICYDIAAAHGGTLTASTPEEGRGMVFSLSLPPARYHQGKHEKDST